LEIEVKVFGGRPMVSAAGELDTWTAETFREAVDGVLQTKPKCVIVDLTQVSYMDSGALQVLVRACRELRADGKVYAIANGIPERLIRTAGLDRLVALLNKLEDVSTIADES
jgi:anti-anti-sigma factor